ncbi:MAG: hypothetical protein K2J10_12245 [Muribaculaceae bacterium]|nr:hypothetical protein [Muribaculaceae bacterium]
MKKLLLLFSSVALSFSPMLAQTDAEPVFPESFKVTTSCDLNVEQGDDYGYTILVTGECPDDTYTITLEVPEGWDGFLCGSDNDANPEVEPLKRLGAFTPGEPDWQDMEGFCTFYEMMMGIPLHKTNSITFSVEEEEHMGFFYLYKGDMVEAGNGIMLNVNVTQKEAEPEPEPDPVFPESFEVTTSCDLDVEQGDEYGFSIKVTGECPDETYTITVEVPEGWDGFLCGSTNDFNPDVEPLKRLDPYNPMEPNWMTIDDVCMLMQFYGLTLHKGNSLTFSVEEEEHMGALFLYKGDMVDFTNGISLNTNVTKKEPDPVFPESFEVTTSCDLDVEQGEDWGAYTVLVSGKCPDDTYSITLGVPEGWDGFLCISYEELNAEPLKRLGSYTPYETMWVDLDEFSQVAAYMGGAVSLSNTITFSTASEEPTGAFYLYKDNMVDAGNGIFVETHVTKDGVSGIESIETVESNARYYNLQGVEVESPKAGIYMKVANGKTTKVLVK